MRKSLCQARDNLLFRRNDARKAWAGVHGNEYDQVQIECFYHLSLDRQHQLQYWK